MGRKAPPPPIIWQDQGDAIQMEVLLAPEYIFRLIFIPSIIPIQVTKFDIFLEFSHLKEYRTQDNGAGGMAVGSPTTIHTNITATSFRLLGIGLRSDVVMYGMYSKSYGKTRVTRFRWKCFGHGGLLLETKDYLPV